MSQRKEGKKRSFLKGALLIVVGGLFLWLAWGVATDPAGISLSLPELPSMTVSTGPDEDEAERVYESSILPLVEHCRERNDAAAERALRSVEEAFDGFRRGIPDFVEELTGWGTRFGILSNLAKDKWDEWLHDRSHSNRVGEYVHEKFRARVMSERDLRRALEQSIQRFAVDATANRNALLAEMKVVLSSASMPVEIRVPEEEFDAFTKDVQRRFVALSGELGKSSAWSGILNLVGGEVVTWGVCKVTSNMWEAAVGYVASTVVAPVISAVSASTTSVSSFVATNTSMATFSLFGGAGGTTAGPAGTIAGIAAGLAVGIVVDWWMSERFEKETASRIETLLSDMERRIVEGAGSRGGAESGLRPIFREANRKTTRIMRQAVLSAMMERSGR